MQWQVVRSYLFSILISILLSFIIVVPVLASDSGTVTATVTPKLISVVVSPNAISYGTVALGQNDVVPNPDTEIVVNNNGTVAEKFSIRGGSASATVGSTTYTWTLSNTSTGADQFMHKYGLGSSYSTFTALSTTYAQFVASEPAGFGESLKFRISMPTSITGLSTQYSTTIDILAEEVP